MHGNCGYISRNSAKLFIINRRRNCWRIPTNRTLRIAPQFKFPKFHFERFEMQKASDERLSNSENKFYRLDRLHHPDNPRQHAENARLGATRDCPWRWWLWEKAAVTGAAQMRGEDSALSVKTKDGAINIRPPHKNANVVR